MASSKRRRGGRTAIEFEQHLRETGKYDEILEHQRKQREEWRRRDVEERLAAAALYRDLEAAGYQVDDVWDLHGRTSYPEAVPVLLKHLSCPYPEKVREGIALAVAVPATLAHWDLLVRLYKEEKEGYIKDRISDAISVVANKDKIDEVISLARDRTLGSSRIMLLRKISRSRNPRGSAALLELVSDPDLVKEVRVILRRKGIKVP